MTVRDPGGEKRAPCLQDFALFSCSFLSRHARRTKRKGGHSREQHVDEITGLPLTVDRWVGTLVTITAISAYMYILPNGTIKA